jgi:hypothetical protein
MNLTFHFRRLLEAIDGREISGDLVSANTPARPVTPVPWVMVSWANVGAWPAMLG